MAAFINIISAHSIINSHCKQVVFAGRYKVSRHNAAAERLLLYIRRLQEMVSS